MNQLINRLLLLMGMLSPWTWMTAQTIINMEQAIEKIQTQHPTILQQDLYIEQQLILKDAGRQQPAFGIGYSAEEFGANGTGVHSIYAQQDFNLPQVALRQQKLQEEAAESGRLQKQISQKQWRQFIASLYQQILFLKNQSKLNESLLEVYKNIETFAQKRAKAGEGGQLPILATQTAKQQLELQQMTNQNRYQIQLTKLQQFLMDNSITDIADSLLVELPYNIQAIAAQDHPLVQKIEQDIQVNTAQSAVIESQLLPQISVGLQTQMVDLTYPNFGAQIGVNVPLFNKGVKAKVKANDLNAKILEQNKIWQVQQLEGQEKIAIQKIQQLQQQIEYLDTNILPNLQQQKQLCEKIFALGESNYLATLQSLEQIISVQNQRLQLLLQLNLAWIDYQFLLEQ